MCGANGALPDTVLCDGGFPTMVTSDSDGTATYGCQRYDNDKCMTGYTRRVIYHSGVSFDGKCATAAAQGKGVYMLMAEDNVVCDDGFYNGSECVKYTENAELCPSGYRDMFTADTVRLASDDTECPSGLSVLGGYDGSHVSDEQQMYVWSYPYVDVPDNMIVLRMCAVGYEMNYLGNCVALCNVSGLRYLRTSTGVIAPVYNSKLTTPSLNIRSGSSKTCYVNMLPESAVGAINVKYNDALYHTVN